MRSNEEFKAELYRRYDGRRKAKALRRRIVTTCVSLALMLCLVLNLFGTGAPIPPGIQPTTTDSVPTPGPDPEVIATQPPDSMTVDLLANFIPQRTEGIAPDDAFINAQMKFSLDLLKQAYTGENTLISPLSVSVALSMTANGAQGDTLAQMEQVLCGGMDIGTWNEYLKHYVNSLPVSDNVKFTLANSIWYNRAAGLTVKPAFLQTVADHYEAAVYAAPFNDSTLSDMNRWIEDNTDGMIREAVQELDGIMYLINALAFDGQWEESYMEDNVQENVFTNANGEIQSVEMMYSEEALYLNDGSATGFLKPYAGGDYYFAALLPNEGTTLDDYVENLTWESLLQTLRNADARRVRTWLPKFEHDCSLSLTEALQALGMEDAFCESLADFSAMAELTEEELYISGVDHITHITVDEQGTKAAAVTITITAPTSAPGEDTVPSVILNRPFLYMIVDSQTNLPIFIGTVTEIE